MGPEDNPVDDMPADKLEYELWEREHAAKDRQYPKCRHCSGENHYGQKYDGYCFDCHNHGVIDLIDERDAAIQRADRAEAERDATENTVLSMQETNVAFSRAIDEVDRLRADVTALIPAAERWCRNYQADWPNDWDVSKGNLPSDRLYVAARAALDRHTPAG